MPRSCRWRRNWNPGKCDSVAGSGCVALPLPTGSRCVQSLRPWLFYSNLTEAADVIQSYLFAGGSCSKLSASITIWHLLEIWVSALRGWPIYDARIEYHAKHGFLRLSHDRVLREHEIETDDLVQKAGYFLPCVGTDGELSTALWFAPTLLGYPCFICLSRPLPSLYVCVASTARAYITVYVHYSVCTVSRSQVVSIM